MGRQGKTERQTGSDGGRDVDLEDTARDKDVIWLDLHRLNDKLDRRRRAEMRRRAEIRRTLQRLRDEAALKEELDNYDDYLH